MHRVRTLAAALVLALCLPLSLAAADGALQGRVTDAGGTPLTRATVTLEGTGFRTLTDGGGAYRFARVPAGRYTLRVRVIGYEPGTVPVMIADGEALRRDVSLRAVPIGLAPVDVVVGSRARHTAADELAVPVDVYGSQAVQAQGTTETSAILAQLAPSMIFPRQSISDGTDVVRPFVLRGLSPDHTLVLLNGRRRHATALVHVFGVALGAGSSGVDLNAIPASAIERIDVLRDGAAAQYGSDAIAGVVNVVLRDGTSAPWIDASWGRFAPGAFPDDGTTLDVAAGWGLPIGRGSLTFVGEYRDRDATNRAGIDPYDQLVAGDGDVTDPTTNTLLEKRNPVPQPTYHWGDGAARVIMTMVNGRLPLNSDGTMELYAFGGTSLREGTGNGFRRSGLSERNWPEIYPLGFLPEFAPEVVDVSGAVGMRGVLANWIYDVSGSYGANRFEFHLDHTLNVSLGPCVTLDPTACASPPLGPDSIPASGDEIPNQTAFFAGALERSELGAGIDLRRTFNAERARPVTLALGGAVRREGYRIERGEPASYVQGWHADRHGDPAPPGSQVFPGFQPVHEADESRTTVGAFADVEARPTGALLTGVAARFEHSDFGDNVSGKLAVRVQPNPHVIVRGAASTGFRAPALSQSVYASTSTNFDPGTGSLRDVAIFPVRSAAARALGAQPLDAETSTGASAGFAWSPTDAVTLVVDAFWTTVEGRILLTSELGGPEIDPILAAAGETQVAAARYFSDALDTRTRGVDVTATYARNAGAGGWLTISAAYNYTRTAVSGDIPTVPGTGVPIFDDGGLNAVTGERPRWRATFTTSYATGRWTVLARGRLYGPYRSSVWSFTEFQKYGSETIVDVELTRTFTNGVELRLGVRNLLDNFPDRTGPVNSFGIMQWPTASPFGFNGRYLYARLHARLGG